jgi:hypothetical protein
MNKSDLHSTESKKRAKKEKKMKSSSQKYNFKLYENP